MLKKQKKISIPHINIYLSSQKTELKTPFLSPKNKSEIQYISTLDSNKSVEPNSITTKILKLLKNDNSTQSADIFNISFSTGVFPTIPKVAKVVPIYNKDSKLDFSSYQPISRLSNTEETKTYHYLGIQ